MQHHPMGWRPRLERWFSQKSTLHQHKDLRLGPTVKNKPAWWWESVSPALGAEQRAVSGSLKLIGQLVWPIRELEDQRKALFQKTSWKVIENTCTHSYVCTSLQMCTEPHGYVYTNTKACVPMYNTHTHTGESILTTSIHSL